MKPFYNLISIFFLVLMSTQVQANEVIVKGQLKFSNGSPVVNHKVYVSADTSTTTLSCRDAKIVYTNPNGFYTATLNCPGNIVRVVISTENCDGSLLVERPQVSSSGVVEKNFIICNPGLSTNCESNFKFENTIGSRLTFHFNSTSSRVSTSADSIVKRRWRFGDGTIKEGNEINPSHTYPGKGIYEVCLTIYTAKGCEKTSCHRLVVEEPVPTCVAIFKFYQSTNSRLTFHFASESSHSTSNTDSIVKRGWRFGDGSIREGNEKNISHTFPGKGVYEVCLTIVTAKGCEKTFCQRIIIEEAPTNCAAIFKFEKSNANRFTFHFKSDSSHGASSTDKIVKRRWKFGDGTILEGNEINPFHTYPGKGVYEVCLTIVTSTGCEKTTCQRIIIEEAPTNCAAIFKFEKSNTNRFTFHFKSDSSHGASSTDKIVKRRWKFGDGTILEGNEINPVHTYPGKGVYEVCLTIVTSAGCEKTTCKKIEIEEPLRVDCNVEFNYTVAASNVKEIRFNSSITTATPADNISRLWRFGDGKESTEINPVHVYQQDGNYRVCLIIKTTSGCVKEICKLVEIRTPKCEAKFIYEMLPATISSTLGYTVRFNSSTSISNDTIVSRTWLFGDGSSANTLDTRHTYTQPGLYNVCLVIKTRSGCESRECKQVLVGPNALACTPDFTYERVSAHKIKFNSEMSKVAAGDEIIERTWIFGDASPVLTGNQRIVEKEYARPGVYTVCLKIKTAKGCENKICRQVRVEDNSPALSSITPIKIVALFPSPVHTQMTTEVWSLNNNIKASLAIYDIYGVKKWEMQKVLLQGNNVTVVATSSLLAGPYFFKVTTMYGVVSRPFYKL